MLQYIICVACVIYSIYFNSVIVKDEFIVVLRDFAGLSRPTFEPFGVSAFDFWIIYYIVMARNKNYVYNYRLNISEFGELDRVFQFSIKRNACLGVKSD